MSLLRYSRKQNINDEIVAIEETINFIKENINRNGRFGTDQWGFMVDLEKELKSRQRKLNELLAEEQALLGDSDE